MKPNAYFCNCKADGKGNTAGAEYQDKIYGKNMRIHTIGKDGKKFFCTVCSKEKGSVTSSEVVPEVKKKK